MDEDSKNFQCEGGLINGESPVTPYLYRRVCLADQRVTDGDAGGGGSISLRLR